MRRLLSLALGLCVGLGGLDSAQAQIKLPVFDPNAVDTPQGIKGVAFEPASDMADFRHGQLLSLTLKNDTKVTGTLVRVDRKSKRLFVRTRPEMAPTAYAESDLKSVEKGVYKGGIRPAGSDASPNVIQPEINRQVIINGNQRTVTYYSTVVSPGERESLDQMARAENDLIALEAAIDNRNRAILHEQSMKDATLRTQQNINMALELLNAIQPVYVSEYQQDYPLVMLNPHKTVIGHLPPVLPTGNGIVESLPAVSPEALSKARETARLSVNRGIYEDGRIIAVVSDDSAPTTK
jgi:hypothetical protein